MQQVYMAHDPTEAHLIKGFLEANGIAALVRGEAVFGVRGEVPVTTETLPTVWVLDDGEVLEARILLGEYGRCQVE